MITIDACHMQCGQKEESMAYVEPLTKREWEVLALVAHGFKNRQIAATLVLSEKTVQNHLIHIYQKLGVTSRIEAVLQANMLIFASQTAMPP